MIHFIPATIIILLIIFVVAFDVISVTPSKYAFSDFSQIFIVWGVPLLLGIIYGAVQTYKDRKVQALLPAKHMDIKCIILNGVARSGKDTFIDILKEQPGVHVIAVSSIDAIKDIAIVCGWKGEKTNEARLMLHNLKHTLTNYNNYPFNQTIDKMAEGVHLTPDDTKLLIFCVTTREPEDIKRYKQFFTEMHTKPLTILIESNYANQTVPDNHSDQGVSNYQYDLYLKNNGTIDEFETLVVANILNN